MMYVSVLLRSQLDSLRNEWSFEKCFDKVNSEKEVRLMGFDAILHVR